jgi:xanthine/uracil permease
MGIAVADIYRYGLWGHKKTERGVQASKQASSCTSPCASACVVSLSSSVGILSITRRRSISS